MAFVCSDAGLKSWRSKRNDVVPGQIAIACQRRKAKRRASKNNRMQY